MGVNRYNPIKDLMSLQEMVDKLFDDIVDMDECEDVRHNIWTPRVDIFETVEEFVVKAELPEVMKEDIEIKVEEKDLTIKGERKFRKDADTNNFHRVERKYGFFRRSFRLPSSIDRNSVDADLKDGILRIALRKKMENRPVRIEIE
ncbi:spore protein SP21 [bacterium BMS3Bbin05]|nr:spore protein SP21 [bacterium BMS3Bbin05]HDL20148.1 Hsp20/alpha crystallin family protein [Nitrospirota bacterium]HDO21554.1 Hsp20/alpha crystallin family protein [Nitrospirota bacterium]